MSPTGLESAHIQWRAQVEAMKEAIAKLNLATGSPDGVPSGHDEDDDDFAVAAPAPVAKIFGITSLIASSMALNLAAEIRWTVSTSRGSASHGTGVAF